jgi:hypothetical protein
VLDHVARDAEELIGDGSDAALILDESGFAKQGKMSVGASRQYLGRLGKVDNGQVAVFGVLAKGRFATAIDTRLYLPKEWTDDAQRCNKAGIPESERLFKTKNQLALEIARAGPSQWSALWLGWGRCGLWQWTGLSVFVWLMQVTPSCSMCTRASSSMGLIRSQNRGPRLRGAHPLGPLANRIR